jgi:triacylglycerol esterase/lipase EstA (alpha/beta hydrolase family)
MAMVALRKTRDVRANSLGLQYNGPRVLANVEAWIESFKSGQNPAGLTVASIQADIVAHSMGGIITRYFAAFLFFLNDVSFPTFGQGPVHKLITIDIPHFGTPLATQLDLCCDTSTVM